MDANNRVIKKLVFLALWTALSFFTTQLKGHVLENLIPLREFPDLPEGIQKDICSNLAQCIVRKDIDCGLLQMFPEYVTTNAWTALPYSGKDFFFMQDLGFRPTRIIRTTFTESNPAQTSEQKFPAYFQLRNLSDKQCYERRIMEGRKVTYSPAIIDIGPNCIFAFFERLKTHEWDSEDIFVCEELCKLDMRDWPDSCRSLWQTSAYGIMPGCAFTVSERHGIPPPTVQLSKGMKKIIDSYYRSARLDNNLHPLIELSDREATEIVYLTALCRGRVKSLDEFNATFVPKGETFLVKLTAAECETAIGQMLYKLVRKRGLIGENAPL